MSTRQQRTRNRRAADPGYGPLPRLLPTPIVESTENGTLLLTYSQNVVLRGVPNLTNPGSPDAVSASQPNPNQVEIVLFNPVAAGDLVTMPEWSPAIRGLNGEWAVGGPLRVDSCGPAGLPVLVVARLVQISGINDLVINFSGPWSPLVAFPLLLDGEAPVSVVQTSPTVLTAEFADSVLSGTPWTIGFVGDVAQPWSAPMWSIGDHAWLAPARGMTT